MSFRVVAACVLAKDQRGLIRHVYEGGIIDWLSPEQEKHFLESGLVEKVGGARKTKAPKPAEPEAETDANDDGDESSDEPAASKPPRVATKDVLVDWLDEHGDYDRDELEGQTKDQLWELIDASE